MQLRASTVADDPDLVEMGRAFHRSLPYWDIPFCEDSARRWFALMRDAGVLLVVEREGEVIGMAGGIFSPCIWNDSLLVGSELLWWVKPEHRKAGAGELLEKGLERAAAAAGCVRWAMVAPIQDAQKLGAKYRALGYEASEISHVKVPQWQ